MTDYNVYVGEVIDESLSWKELGDSWERNVRRIKYVDGGMESMLSIIDMIDDGTLEGRQVDWGAWVANVSKEQLLRMYPPREPPIDPAVYRPFLKGKSDDEIIDHMNFDPARWIAELPDKQYVLVAIEGV
jgi:hypothetical protein